MINLTEFGTASFNYFPTEILESRIEGELKQEYLAHKSKLHTDDLWDLSKIQPGMKVKTNDGFEGVVTEYHLTEVGQLNGGVEVDLGNRLDYYYPHQIKLIA